MIVKLDDVIEKINGNEDRFNTDLIYYIGGEHYESRRLRIYNKGLLDSEDGRKLGFKFHFPFKVGDYLFMNRNPHLKKGGIATFDGICSDASFVLRSKCPEILLQGYLPFVFQSDRFWKFCEENKSGSVNYLVNWKTLQEYRFALPDISEQKRYIELLESMEDCRYNYEILITKTYDLIKSRYYQIVKSADKNQSVKLDSVLTQYKKTEKITDTQNEQYISVALYGKGISKRDIGNDAIKSFSGVRIKEGQFVYSRIWVRKGASGLVPSELHGAVVTNEFPVFDYNSDKINPVYLLHTVQDEDFLKQIDSYSLGSTTKQRIKESTFLNLDIVLPPIETQNCFAEFVSHCEESVRSLKDSISNIESMMLSLINSCNSEEG